MNSYATMRSGLTMALHRTRPLHSCCSRQLSLAGSVSLVVRERFTLRSERVGNFHVDDHHAPSLRSFLVIEGLRPFHGTRSTLKPLRHALPPVSGVAQFVGAHSGRSAFPLRRKGPNALTEYVSIQRHCFQLAVEPRLIHGIQRAIQFAADEGSQLLALIVQFVLFGHYSFLVCFHFVLFCFVFHDGVSDANAGCGSSVAVENSRKSPALIIQASGETSCQPSISMYASYPGHLLVARHWQ